MKKGDEFGLGKDRGGAEEESLSLRCFLAYLLHPLSSPSRFLPSQPTLKRLGAALLVTFVAWRLFVFIFGNAFKKEKLGVLCWYRERDDCWWGGVDTNMRFSDQMCMIGCIEHVGINATYFFKYHITEGKLLKYTAYSSNECREGTELSSLVIAWGVDQANCHPDLGTNWYFKYFEVAPDRFNY
uniref:Uncharacterized protein n=1 Tax=Chromera velia CCMP2878 TaxID=1169474 RepID=A0A0G4FNG9_9ALVE|mmetsp:Transcript_34439/g.68107  ORF Transcript_34439/g.68107 Transcript_34439/m.68107 type:complete len:184 (+) Transcript_34439:256-807(+)|eukprot:Cvel_17856.t1-p1 / transcript=Cvel_17856.t1 / gene=Cvel_17856 / organism=Chromera_velia_CCMP2878 / gene_product=hypothetical protein / transcript_product=hypothetical protein / location=Cvel_scaffold1448:12870-13418(-) / protein_length=183 / sequence_SO=supercontig / SO=protein_coding / is_pseudo=false